jgi:hypothetical protein
MRHQAKIDWWIAAAIMVAIVLPAAEEHYWIAALPLLILLSCCVPQSYETTSTGLLIRAGLVRRHIPYRDITFIGPGSDGRYNLGLSFQQVKIHYGRGSELAIAPADLPAFLADMQARAPHLRRYGRNLVLAFA